MESVDRSMVSHASSIPPDVLLRGMDLQNLPPDDRSVTSTGSLVMVSFTMSDVFSPRIALCHYQVSGLKSERGQALNGRYGEVVGLTTTGRVELQLYSKGSAQQQSEMGPTETEAISAKPENLTLRESCCDIFKSVMTQRYMALAQRGQFPSASACLGTLIVYLILRLCLSPENQ